MSPERALAIRVGRLRKKTITATKRLFPTSEMTKQILVFQQGEFHHLMRGFALFRTPDGELGVSNRKVVYSLQHSGEYLFIDISGGKASKKACLVVSPTVLSSERLRVTSSLPLQSLAEKFFEHTDGPMLKKLASKVAVNPATTASKPHVSASAMTYADRWLRQLNLSQNQNATEEVRRKALIQLAKIEEEMASLDDHFKWPSTDAATGSGNLKSFDAPSDGILSFFGYQVGQASQLSSATRYLVLDRVFRIKLPPVLPSSHLALWGPPNSGRRLKKIAETIAALVRNAKRRCNASYSRAISEWEFDLERLHDAFYVGQFDFGWPPTR